MAEKLSDQPGVSACGSATAARPPKIKLMGVPIDTFTPQTLVEHLIHESHSGKGGHLITPNVDTRRRITTSEELLQPAGNILRGPTRTVILIGRRLEATEAAGQSAAG